MVISRSRAKGSQANRFAIRFFTFALSILIFWALGFIVADIKSTSGPEYAPIETRYLNPQTLSQQQTLNRKLEELNRQIQAKQEEQRLVGESSKNLQQTINQLLDLQKITLQKALALSDSTQQNLSTSLNRFLENQKTYQTLNSAIADLTAEKHNLEAERQQLETQLDQQRIPAQAEFERLSQQHRFKVAAIQLAILLPLMALASFLVMRKRSSVYSPLVFALGVATLLRIVFVLWEYFPARWFQYILIGALILVVGTLLTYFIRSVAFPKTQFLVQQFREAYQSFLCPICDYPMRTGPRRYLFWTRRTVNKIIVPANTPTPEEPYTCPACGTGLLETCPECQQIRHSLLPHCQHCGAANDIQYTALGQRTA